MTVTVAASGTDRAPDLIAPVVGFRQWRVVAGELRSVHCDEKWLKATVAARCDARQHPNESAPVNGCSCGVYAWYRPSPRTASAGTCDLVAGAVVLWGRVELHGTGMRGQYCRVVALASPLLGVRKRAHLVAVADALGVAVVAHRRLREVAARHGAPVPGQLIPPRVSSVAFDQPAGVVPKLVLAAIGRGDSGS